MPFKHARRKTHPHPSWKVDQHATLIVSRTTASASANPAVDSQGIGPANHMRYRADLINAVLD